MVKPDSFWSVRVIYEDATSKGWIVRAGTAWSAVQTLMGKPNDFSNIPIGVTVWEVKEELVL